MQTKRMDTTVMRHDADHQDRLTKKGGLTRRQLLGAGAGAGLSAALLGGGAFPSGVMGRAVRAQDGGADLHVAWPYQVSPQGHFNYFVADSILGPSPDSNIYGDLITLPLALYYWGTGEWLPILATEWSFIQTGAGAAATPGASPVASPVASPAASAGADTFQVKLRQGVVWSDGTEFNAEDVVTTYNIMRVQARVVWDFLSAVEMVDPYTVNFVMSQPSSVVERYALRWPPRPRSIYGDLGQRAGDLFAGGATADSPEVAALNEEINQFRPEQVVANGPYNIDVASITSAQMTLTKNQTGYAADQAPFDRIVNYNGETDQISAVVLAKEVDYATHGFAVATEQQMLQTGIRVLRPPIYSGPALYFNYATLGNVFGDKRVRQAIAHAVDRAQNGVVSLAESGVAVQYMSGMSDNLVPDWIDPAVTEQLNQYPFDQERAAALLQEVGWTKNGDRWQTPDGQPASFELKFPAEFADWSASGADLAQQLTAFGIEIIPRAINFNQALDDANDGAFQLTIRGWGGSNNPHPHFSYVQDLFTHNQRGAQDSTPGMSFPLVQQTDSVGEVDLDALTVQSAVGLDQAQQVGILTTLAQAFNELLPIIPIFERYGNNAALEGVRVQAWPADEDPILRNSPYADGIPTILLLTGGLQPASG